MTRLPFLSVLGVIALVAFTSPAKAIVFTGSSGTLKASVEFTIVGGNLQVVLTNTSTNDVLVPTDVLTAVFFDWPPSNPALTPVSAVLNAGSTVLFGTTDPGNVVGGEWAFNSGLSGAPGSAVLGVSSTGLGLFGPGDLFPGTDLQSPASPDGLQYGLTSAGDNSATGNAAVTGGNALIKNSVVFTLSGVPAGSDLSTITNVFFLYGTALDEPVFQVLPSPIRGHSPALPNRRPSLFGLLGAGWAGLAVVRRRNRIGSRQPWSPESRTAIQSLIESGRNKV